MLSYLLLLFIPASLVPRLLFDAGPLLVFATSAIAVAVLAAWVRQATEHLAERAGSTVDGLLNVPFGSIAELAPALFVLANVPRRRIGANYRFDYRDKPAQVGPGDVRGRPGP